jgi:hypothetical protein
MNFRVVATLLLIALVVVPISNAWKYAVAGDTRSNHDDHRKVISGIINKIPNNERVTVINSGDLTSDGSEGNWQTWANIVEPLDIDWSKKSPPEYIGAVGNHDAGGSGWQDRWADHLPAQVGISAYSGVTAHSKGLYGSAKYDNAIFIWVDSDSLPSGQESFLEDTLQMASQDPDVVWKFVAFHHPPIPCGAKSDWSHGKSWHNDYFVPYGVDIVWLGHAHYYERTCPIVDAYEKSCDENNRGEAIGQTDGVIHIVAGGGGAPIYGTPCDSACSECPWLEKGASRHHLVEVEVTGNTLNARVWNTDNNMQLIDEFTISKGSAPPQCIAGDLNCDGNVDIFDLVLVAQNFGMTSGFDSRADANGDSRVDIFDLVVVAQNFGRTS